MKKNLLLALSIVLVIVSVSCNKADKTGLLVPKDAAVVVHLNLESLSSKLSWDEIKSTTWFREMEKEDQSSDTLHKQLLQDPSMSGIDSKSNIIFFMKRVGKGGYFSVVGGLKDAAKFEAMVKKGGKEDAEITKDGDLTVATMKKDHGAVMIWNNATFIVVSNAPIGSMIGRPSNMMNHNEMEAGGLNFSTDSLRLFAKQILNLKGDDLLDNDERFSSLVKESGDLHFWVNSEKLTGNSLAGMVQMMKFDVLFEKNITTGTLNFDNGKISVKSKQYFGDEMTKLLKNNPPKNVGSDVINRLPNDNVFVAGVFNYPPQGLKELLKLTGADGMANGFFGEMNYSVDEFIKANKGDIAFALTDFTMKRDSIPTENLDGTTNFYFRSKPTFNYVAGVSVNDKDAFNKLIGIMTKEMGSQLGDMGVKYKLENDWFVASNNEAGIASFLDGRNKPVYADKISGHNGGGYVDINRILKTFVKPRDTAKDGAADPEQDALNASIGMWQDAVVYGDFKGGTVESLFEVNLVDKTTNSLKQLNKYFDQLSLLRPKHHRVDMKDVAVDTVSVAPPMPVK